MRKITIPSANDALKWLLQMATSGQALPAWLLQGLAGSLICLIGNGPVANGACLILRNGTRPYLRDRKRILARFFLKAEADHAFLHVTMHVNPSGLLPRSGSFY